ncbi:MAG: hypothetical protein AB1515_06060 [Nitrospirota bacterium]
MAHRDRLLRRLVLLLAPWMPLSLYAADAVHNHVGNGLPRPPSDQAFSEFSHHLAGWFVLALAAGEFRNALWPARWVWARALPAIGLLGAGLWLLVWSDIDTWAPAAGFIQPFLAGDWEAIQHKIYAALLLSIGAIEWLRQQGRLTHAAWRWPLPLFAIAGGALLVPHMHHAAGDLRLIQQHHQLLGATAVLAGLVKLAPEVPGASWAQRRDRWDVAWAALVLLIGIELLLYAE